jgi:hypothetical protein
MSDAADAAGQILSQQANLRTLRPQYVGSQILLMGTISVRVSQLSISWAVEYNCSIRVQVLTVLVFNVLRPKNKVSKDCTVSTFMLNAFFNTRESMSPKSNTTSGPKSLPRFLVHSLAGFPL